MKIIYAIPALMLSFAAQDVNAATLPGIPEFINEMVVKHQFKRAELESVFDHAQHLPNVIETISRPSTSRPWLEYRTSFVNAERIKFGLQFWNKYRQTLQHAERKYRVPQEIILAVIGVETVYGRDVGTFRTLDALTTLAFDFPRRAEFFRSELENYLLLAREQQFDLLETRGSYAGALGIPQFMPSSYRNYAVDFNGNHHIDLLREPRDAIGSVANYLREYGWDGGLPKPGSPTSSPTSQKNESALTQPIVIPVQVSEPNNFSDETIIQTAAAWSAAGVVVDEHIFQIIAQVPVQTPARLIEFTVADGKEYWLAFNNFEVIKRYNNSDFYAMTVFQLAEALKAAHKPAAMPTRTRK